MTKIVNTNTALTADSLEKSGFKTEITQNDIIELIAQERYDIIIKEMDNINSNYKTLSQLIEDYKVEQQVIFRGELVTEGLITQEQSKDLRGVQSTLFSNNNSWPENFEFGYLLLDDYTRKTKLKHHCADHKLFDNKSIYTLAFELVKTSKNGGDRKSFKFVSEITEKHVYTKEIKLGKSFIKKFNQALLDHCLRTKEFYFRYKDVNLDLEKIIRDTKNKLNKQLLKNQAPIISAKIESMFGIAI